jgi:hypothetical protein
MGRRNVKNGRRQPDHPQTKPEQANIDNPIARSLRLRAGAIPMRFSRPHRDFSMPDGTAWAPGGVPPPKKKLPPIAHTRPEAAPFAVFLICNGLAADQ